MKVVIPGGSGFVGTYFANRFVEQGDQVYILTRGQARTSEEGITYLNWDGKSALEHKEVFEGADLVLNLTGKSVDCRYTEKNKSLILSSRVESTRAIGEVLASLKSPVKYWMNSSSATIYESTEEIHQTEDGGQVGDDFSMGVCKAWEKEFNSHELPETKQLALRITLVLGKEGGVLPVLTKLAKLGLGGKNGTGRQFFSWIHESDFFDAVLFAMESGMEGAMNIASPNPVTDGYFNQQVAKQARAWIAIPKPGLILSIGAMIMGTETELVLKSRRVYPEHLIQRGFKFKYPVISGALENLMH